MLACTVTCANSHDDWAKSCGVATLDQRKRNPTLFLMIYMTGIQIPNATDSECNVLFAVFTSLLFSVSSSTSLGVGSFSCSAPPNPRALGGIRQISRSWSLREVWR